MVYKVDSVVNSSAFQFKRYSLYFVRSYLDKQFEPPRNSLLEKSVKVIFSTNSLQPCLVMRSIAVDRIFPRICIIEIPKTRIKPFYHNGFVDLIKRILLGANNSDIIIEEIPYRSQKHQYQEPINKIQTYGISVKRPRLFYHGGSNGLEYNQITEAM